MEIDRRARYVPDNELSDHQKQLLQKARELETEILRFLDFSKTRSNSIAQTHFQTAFMWLRNGIAKGE